MLFTPMKENCPLLTRALFWLLWASVVLTSCADPTSVGAELLEEDLADLGFTDTVSVMATVVESDSVITYSLGFQLESYLFGKYQDPLFGLTESTVNIQIRLPRNRPILDLAERPEFVGTTLDSIYLILPYDPDGYYGSFGELFTMEAYRITDEFENTELYYSSDRLAFDDLPRLDDFDNPPFKPGVDSTAIYTYSNGEVDTNLTFIPHLRLRLDESIPILQEAFFNIDDEFYGSDDSLLNVFKGMHLRTNTTTEGLASFNLRSTLGGIYVYGTEPSTDSSFHYQFEINEFSVRSVQFEHTYDNSAAEAFIGSTELSDSLLFVQGMQGVNSRLTFPFVEDLKGIIVNKAELEIAVAEIAEDNPAVYLPPEQILIAEPLDGDETQLQLISDIILSGNANSLDDLFGGLVESGGEDAPDVYRFNISSHFQDMIDGVVANEIYLLGYPLSTIADRGKAERANRVVLYGPGHSTYPIKLNLTFTRL